MHASGVAKSSTSFGWGKGGKVTAAGWQVTPCDPTWHVISRSGEVKFTNCYTLFTLIYCSVLTYGITGLNIPLGILQVISEMIFPVIRLTGAKMPFKPNGNATSKP